MEFRSCPDSTLWFVVVRHRDVISWLLDYSHINQLSQNLFLSLDIKHSKSGEENKKIIRKLDNITTQTIKTVSFNLSSQICLFCWHRNEKRWRRRRGRYPHTHNRMISALGVPTSFRFSLSFHTESFLLVGWVERVEKREMAISDNNNNNKLERRHSCFDSLCPSFGSNDWEDT